MKLLIVNSLISGANRSPIDYQDSMVEACNRLQMHVHCNHGIHVGMAIEIMTRVDRLMAMTEMHIVFISSHLLVARADGIRRLGQLNAFLH